MVDEITVGRNKADDATFESIPTWISIVVLLCRMIEDIEDNIEEITKKMCRDIEALESRGYDMSELDIVIPCDGIKLYKPYKYGWPRVEIKEKMHHI